MAEPQQHLGFKLTRTKGPLSWVRLCLDCRDVLGCFSHLSVLKKQQRCTTLAMSIQNVIIETEFQTTYTIRTHYKYMNHSEVYIANYTTLNFSQQKFTVRYTSCLWLGYIYCKLPLTSVLGGIFASLLWFNLTADAEM